MGPENMKKTDESWSSSASTGTSRPIQRSVLVIDDSQDILFLNRTILEMDGYEVFTAESGNAAFALLANIPRPHLILLDLRMQDMSGLEFLLKLEKGLPEIFENTPVVFHTAMDDVPKSRAAGLIMKPIEIDKFLEAISHFIEISKKLAQGPIVAKS